MKSCTGRGPGLGVGAGGGGTPASGKIQHAHLGLWQASQPLHAHSAFLPQLRSATGEQGAAERPGEVPHTDPAAHGQQVRAVRAPLSWKELPLRLPPWGTGLTGLFWKKGV